LIYPVPEKIEGVANKYALVIAAAKRTRQLVDGAPPFVHSESANSLTIALQELASGAIIAVQAPEPEPQELEGEPEALRPLSGVASAGHRLDATADDLGSDVDDLLEELETDTDLEEPEDLEAVVARSLMGPGGDEEEPADQDEDLEERIVADSDLEDESIDSDKVATEGDGETA